MIYALITKTPHETEVSLHTTQEEAKKAMHDFLLAIYAQTQHSSYEGLPTEGLELEDLLNYFDEISYEILPTKLPKGA